MVIEKGKTINNIDIVAWDFEYPNTHFYSIMAYPVAIQNDYKNPYGASRGEKICIDISFNSLEELKKAFNELIKGDKTILDFKDNITNKLDLEFI